MILSCITMLIDHVGCVFFSGSPVWRIIGRLAMPIYAYFISEGYNHTSDIGRYIKRIALIAVVSQLPFMLLFDIRKLNMCFAWLFSLLIIYGIDKKNYHILTLSIIVSVPILLTISIDYSYYGICLPILFYIRSKSTAYYKDLVLFFSVGLLMIPFKNLVQLIAMISMPIIFIAEKYDKTRVGNRVAKKCYQCFYPAHMLVLLIINTIIVK